MALIINYIVSFLKALNKISYKFSLVLKFIIIYFESKYASTQDPLSKPTYYEPFRKFSVDGEPIFEQIDKLNYKELLDNYFRTTGKIIKPINRRSKSSFNFDGNCPICNAPHDYIYDNNSNGQFRCKICSNTFVLNRDYLDKISLKCPHCNRTLERKKDRKGFSIFKCTSLKCSFYQSNIRKLTKSQRADFLLNPGKYKLHYIYRAFNIDIPTLSRDCMPDLNIKVDLSKIRNSQHVLGLILTYYVNYGLSARKTASIMYDIHQVKISHQTIANYVHSVAPIVLSLLENYPYELSNNICGDETYVKVKGEKHYIFFFSDKDKKIITSYQVFPKRDTLSAIKSMYQTFKKYINSYGSIPDNLNVIVDGNPIYNAAKVFFSTEDINFDLYQVIGLTNDSQVDWDYRPFKQTTERLNRTFKDDYIQMNGFGSIDNANSYMVLFCTFFNFLRRHKSLNYKTPVIIDSIDDETHMPSKWLDLIDLSYSYAV